jgi:hypothetical protein
MRDEVIGDALGYRDGAPDPPIQRGDQSAEHQSFGEGETLKIVAQMDML